MRWDGEYVPGLFCDDSHLLTINFRKKIDAVTDDYLTIIKVYLLKKLR
jgi:hypothetical protein